MFWNDVYEYIWLQVVFSTTIVDGKSCMRAAIVNHRTTKKNIEECIEAIAEEVLAQAKWKKR